MARSKYVPTDAERNTVRIMAACGVPQEQIALCVNGTKGISEPTLRKHFAVELKTAYLLANAQAGAKLFEAVNRGEAWAVCFWLKCRARWQEVVRYEHANPPGETLTVDVNADSDPKQLLESRMAQLAKRLSPARSDPEHDDGADRSD